MATEQPQTLPVDQKVTESAPNDTPNDEMMVDESGAQAVNGHSKSDEDKTMSDDKPVINGKAESSEPTSASADDSLNRKAFTANNSLPEPTPTKSISEPPPTGDTDMSDVNGTSPVKDKSPPSTDEDKVAAADPSTPEKAPTAEPNPTTQDSAPNNPVLEDTVDSMDVDATDHAASGSSAGQANSAGDKSAADDMPAATSSQELNQSSTGLSKLDIKDVQPDSAASQPDTPMTDQPTSAGKVSREREEDSGDERAAKRAKTDEDNSEPAADSMVVASALPAAPVSNEYVDQVPDDQAITPFQSRQLRQVLAGVKKTKNGLNFRQSVEKLWPVLWEDYKNKVEKPVDISLFESKLREERYSTYGAFKADVRLLYENSLTFNGDTNAITLAAAAVKDHILGRLAEISTLEEPAKPEKGKAHPTRHTEPRAATQPRRQSQPQSQSQSQPRAPAASPKQRPTPPAPAAQPTSTSSSAPAPAFAIPPNGIPQIRRDSTREDSDRPKRPIHPPKNRDLDYASANRKKLEPEQRFFEVALDEIKKGKHYTLNQWFLTPVDPVALNIPTYFSVVKKPMDLATMTQKNYEGEYKNVKDIEKDMKLIVHNAELFNGQNHDVTLLARRLEELFKGELAKREQWMKKHYPPEAPSATHVSVPSPLQSPHDSEDGSEADGDDDNEVGEAVRSLQTRLDEEQEKLYTLLDAKKPDLTMIEIQQQMVSILQRKLVQERAKMHNEKKPKSKKKSTKSKPKSGGGGAVSTGTKKAAAGSIAASKKAPNHNASHKKSAPKVRPVGQLEKAVIAEGINELDGNTLTKAVEIIKKDTGQNENDDGEMELDIDALTMDALRKLYDLIHKSNPSIRAALEKKPEFSNAAEADHKSKAVPKPKKNKPMNKHEQERKIEQLRELKAQLQRHGSGSQEPQPGEVEDNQPAESSDEDSDSEEE
ncbi:Bromodomain-containing protein [Hypoxylon crocopeplum]|nr:Bromodomain-containing protein [Hypoxylon crocopeplum]